MQFFWNGLGEIGDKIISLVRYDFIWSSMTQKNSIYDEFSDNICLLVRIAFRSTHLVNYSTAIIFIFFPLVDSGNGPS
jgi:hypothetical protein